MVLYCVQALCGGMMFLPIFTFIWGLLSVMTSYGISVSLNHTDAWLPFISDTGAKVPESCIFGQLVNIEAVLYLFTIYVRYKNVSEFNSELVSRPLEVLNVISLIIGMIGALGISIVGNFQETTVLSMHVIGAFMIFVLGNVYMIVQIMITLLVRRMFIPSPNKVLIVQLIIFLIGFISLVTTFVTMAKSFDLGAVGGLLPYRWNPTDSGYGFHIASTVTEWSLAIAIFAFPITFAGDFRKIRLETRIIQHSGMMTHPSDDIVVT